MNRTRLFRGILGFTLLFILLKFKIRDAIGLTWYVLFLVGLYTIYKGHNMVKFKNGNIEKNLRYDILNKDKYMKYCGKESIAIGINLLLSFIFIRLISAISIWDMYVYGAESLLIILNFIIYIVLNVIKIKYFSKNDIILIKKKD